MDVAIEAVGALATLELCTQLVRPGGHLANIGVHSAPATSHLESLWIKDITITTGPVDTYSTPTLLRLVATRQIEAVRFVTHRFLLGDMLQALRRLRPRGRHRRDQGRDDPRLTGTGACCTRRAVPRPQRTPTETGDGSSVAA